MPRAARRLRWTDAACYHVLNRGHARETIFHDDEDRSQFLRLLGRYRERYGFAEGMLPVSEDCSARTMALPFHARLERADQERVAEALRAALG